jgi:hypothetical protein
LRKHHRHIVNPRASLGMVAKTNPMRMNRSLQVSDTDTGPL